MGVGECFLEAGEGLESFLEEMDAEAAAFGIIFKSRYCTDG